MLMIILFQEMIPRRQWQIYIAPWNYFIAI